MPKKSENNELISIFVTSTRTANKAKKKTPYRDTRIVTAALCFIYKRIERSDSTLRHSLFDILRFFGSLFRGSVVFGSRLQRDSRFPITSIVIVNVLVIDYCNLRFICNLVLVIWNLISLVLPICQFNNRGFLWIILNIPTF